MAMASKINVAVIGGSGMLGKHLVNGFLNNGKYKVTVITRPGGAAKLAPFTSRGAIAAEADLNDNASMKSAFKGQDIVVSAVGAAGVPDQPKWIEAAKAAGVRRFVPSEFGLDISEPGMAQAFKAVGMDKIGTREAVEASGLEWTYIINGMFLETNFTAPFFFDVPNGKAIIKGNPDALFTLTSLEDVGKWTAEALLDPASKNATIYLKGQDISYNEAIKTAEEVTGKKMEITHVSREEIDKESAATDNGMLKFLNLLLAAVSDGKVNPPSPVYRAGVKPFRGPADGGRKFIDYAKTTTWAWEGGI